MEFKIYLTINTRRMFKIGEVNITKSYFDHYKVNINKDTAKNVQTDKYGSKLKMA